MGWFDQGFGDWFGGDLGSSGGGGSGFDWGSVDLGSLFGGGDSGGGVDLGNLGGSGSSGSNGSGWGSVISSIFGGGNGSSTGSNIFGALLGGLGGMAEAKLSGKDAMNLVKEQGNQNRKNTDFEAALKDYYTQLGKQRQRRALDTYGQFSLMNRINPGYKDTPPVDVPTKPNSGSY